MSLNRRTFLRAASGCAVLGAAVPAGVHAQEASGHYPTRPINFVVPFAAGGGNDVLARIIATPLSAMLGQPVVVDNRAGAGGNVGAQYVARSAPDGYSMLLAANGVTLNPYLMKDIPFDIVKDFATVARVANQPIVVVVNPSVPAKNMRELVAYLKANPGKVSYASPGVGTPHHFATELFKQTADVSMVHIPYKGASPALTDLISNQVQVMFASVISALPFIQAGKIRCLATAEGHRLSVLPDIPTVKESGYPTYESTIWGGILVAEATPAPIVKKLGDSVLRVLDMPDVKASLQKAGFELARGDSAELRELIRSDLVQWGKVAKAIGLQPQ